MEYKNIERLTIVDVLDERDVSDTYKKLARELKQPIVEVVLQSRYADGRIEVMNHVWPKGNWERIKELGYFERADKVEN